MKKTAIAASLLLAAAGAAHADYNLYGLLDASVGKGIPGQKADFHSGGDDGGSQGNSVSRIGLKGSTDVGSGYKVNFNLETNGIQSDGTIDPPFFKRQAWLGISGAAGEFRLGRQESVAFHTMINFDFNGASNTASAYGNVGVAPWLTGRESRSLQYIAPTFYGLTVQAGYTPEGNDDPAAKDFVSASVAYKLGGLNVAVAGETKRTTAANAVGSHAFGSAAASYDFGFAKFGLTYGSWGTDLKGFGLGATSSLAGFNFGLQLARNTDAKVNAYEAWVNREVLKNTYAYLDLGYVNKDFTSAAQTGVSFTKGNRYALGVIYVF